MGAERAPDLGREAALRATIRVEVGRVAEEYHRASVGLKVRTETADAARCRRGQRCQPEVTVSDAGWRHVAVIRPGMLMVRS